MQSSSRFALSPFREFNGKLGSMTQGPMYCQTELFVRGYGLGQESGEAPREVRLLARTQFLPGVHDNGDLQHATCRQTPSCAVERGASRPLKGTVVDKPCRQLIWRHPTY